MRNQMIAIVLMVILTMVWFRFFLPAPRSTTPQTPAQGTQQAAAPAPGSATPGTQETETPRPSFLPPPAVQPDPAADEVTIENGDLKAVLTAVGARLKRAHVRMHLHGKSEIQLVPEPKTYVLPGTQPQEAALPLPDADQVYPLALRFGREDIGDALDQVRFEAIERTPESVVFEAELPGLARVRKSVALTATPYVLDVRVEYVNTSGAPVVLGKDEEPAFSLNWGPNVDSRDLTKGVRQGIMWRQGDKTAVLATANLKPQQGKDFLKSIAGAEWIATRSAYFTVAMKSEPGPGSVWVTGNPAAFRFGSGAPRAEVAPGATLSHAWRVYVGPTHVPNLAAAWSTLATARRFFESDRWWFMDKFTKFLLYLLNGFHAAIPSYGLAIIILTILVRSALIPLTIKQMASMKRMQLLGPEIEVLKQKYADDQQEFSRRMMELYRERGVNPMGGCLPMFLQLPVLVALYRMIWSTYELRGAPFTLLKFGGYRWIADLAEPDHLIHVAGFAPWIAQVPFLGPYLTYVNLLPILGAVAMVMSTKLMPSTGPGQTQQQKTMMAIMPVFVSAICYNLASGVNLYILVSTVLGVVQSKVIQHINVKLPDKKPPRKKRQHFYVAAQERKRQLAKSIKEAAKKDRLAQATDPAARKKRPAKQPHTHSEGEGGSHDEVR